MADAMPELKTRGTNQTLMTEYIPVLDINPSRSPNKEQALVSYMHDDGVVDDKQGAWPPAKYAIETSAEFKHVESQITATTSETTRTSAGIVHNHHLH